MDYDELGLSLGDVPLDDTWNRGVSRELAAQIPVLAGKDQIPPVLSQPSGDGGEDAVLPDVHNTIVAGGAGIRFEGVAGVQVDQSHVYITDSIPGGG